jgi:hypothetical protein
VRNRNGQRRGRNRCTVAVRQQWWKVNSKRLSGVPGSDSTAHPLDLALSAQLPGVMLLIDVQLLKESVRMFVRGFWEMNCRNDPVGHAPSKCG